MPMGDTKHKTHKAAYNVLLSEVDIKTAISYFGATELLDSIGLDAIMIYLSACRHDGLDSSGGHTGPAAATDAPLAE